MERLSPSPEDKVTREQGARLGAEVGHFRVGIGPFWSRLGPIANPLSGGWKYWWVLRLPVDLSPWSSWKDVWPVWVPVPGVLLAGFTVGPREGLGLEPPEREAGRGWG